MSRTLRQTLRDRAKNAAQAVAGRLGLRLVRRGAENRFDAMETSLRQLRAAGFAPGVVIDVGANQGEWTRMASRVFPGAAFHLVEPQPECAPALEALAAGRPDWSFHPCIATRGGIETATLAGSGTGAHVVGVEPAAAGAAAPPGAAQLPAASLDQLFSGLREEDGPAFLKLDVESHELEVLAGARELLRRVEVVLSEVHFYQVDGDDTPLFVDLAGFLRQEGFRLFDFASLSGRPRDGRLRLGDALFVAEGSPLLEDDRWA